MSSSTLSTQTYASRLFESSFPLYVKAGSRLMLILYLGFSLSWSCLFCLGALAASYYFFSSESRTTEPSKSVDGHLPNPFKGKVGRGYLTDDEAKVIERKISDMVVYDAGNTQSLRNFEVLKQKSECHFSRKAKVWGSPNYEAGLSIEENIQRLGPTFYKFTLAFQSLGLDAFLIEVPESFCANIKTFGDAVRRILLTLREIDLKRRREETRSDSELDEDIKAKRLQVLSREETRCWDYHGWVFEFNRTTFFVTTFAPFYPETNSRYSFGTEQGYILFQPEISFAIRDLPPDTAHTNWVSPKNIRDKIRVAFRDAGREYEAPLKLGEPMVHEIVKRVEPEDDVTQWWLPPGGKGDNS